VINYKLTELDTVFRRKRYILNLKTSHIVSKQTVRFPDEVVESVESHVGDEEFTSISEFHRFEYKEIKRSTVYTGDTTTPQGVGRADERGEFLQTAGRVRQYALRGDIETAYELIDNRYDPSSPMSMFLDLIVRGAAGTQRSDDNHSSVHTE
jgi:Arc/MetJ-type ribon-helix-helix transcriptional regulator